MYELISQSPFIPEIFAKAIGEFYSLLQTSPQHLKAAISSVHGMFRSNMMLTSVNDCFPSLFIPMES